MDQNDFRFIELSLWSLEPMATKQNARRVFIGLLVLALFLLALIIRPFAEAFFLAAVLAGTLYGLSEKLIRLLRGRRVLGASFICVGVVIALLMPLGGLTAFIVAEAVDGVRYVQQTVQSEGVAGLTERLPAPFKRGADKLLERMRFDETKLNQTLSQVGSQSGKAAQAVGGVLSATGSLAFQAVMMLIALFFFLVDGQRLIDWVASVSPLEHGQTRELLNEFRNVSVAVLVSTVATAGVQAVVALVGYLIARVPQPFFFSLVTFFIAFIPAVGAAGVCLAAAALLLLSGHPFMALFLALWGILVVGLVDNVVKPLLVKRGMHMHGALVFFALLGGLAAFGAVGLVLGPLIVAFFLALVRIYERDYGRPTPVPAAPSTPPV